MPNIAVILSGCGFLDGAEIRESVLSLLYLDEAGAEVHIFAPDVAQHDVINHLSGEATGETRNVRVEAARIARGKVADLSNLKAEAFDALVIPGGYGVAKNLSDFAFKGTEGTVLPAFQAAVTGFLKAGKPIGAICISPAVLALAARDAGIELTVGQAGDAATAIEALGHTHKVCATDCTIVDTAHHVASCPAYMDDATLAEVASGIRAVVKEVLMMVDQQQKAA